MSRRLSAGYQPADAIYTKNITDNDKWTKSSIFYLSNPQLLVIEASKGRISPFPYWAGGAQDLRAELRCYDKRMRFPMAPMNLITGLIICITTTIVKTSYGYG